MRGLSGAMGQLQGAMAAAGPYIAIAAGIAAAAGAALKFSNEIDRNRQQLTLFTKNVEATNAIIADLKTTADATSLGLPGLIEATKTLAAYGVTAKNAGTATKLLSDLALGDNEKLQRFAVNLGQISSIGRAYTVDLKQFAMAGIPIFEALAKVMGTSTSGVLRLAEQGKVTYPIVIKAINELTKEGASFYNGAEKGGTDLDRSLNQLTGAFENLQTIIGTAVGPTAVAAVLTLKDALDGVLLVVKYLSNEFEYFSGLISKSDFGHTIINELKFVTKYLQENPDLMMALNPGTKVLGPVGEFLGPLGKIAQNQKKEDKKTSKKTDPTQLLNESNAIAEKNAITELANLRIENDNKIAKLNKNRELQLKDNRLQYEQQIADFRVSTLRRIADMERDLEDQRVKANFDLQQSNLKLAGSRQFIGQTQDISRAIVSGKSPAEIQSLQTARDSAKTLNDAAVTRRQIEFDSTMKKIQLERTLTDFKRGIEREIGEMQKNYARQVAGILRTAGRTLSDLMVEGAKKAKQILESVSTAGGAGGGTAGPSLKSGIIARTGSTGDSTGPHLDIRWADGRPITKADADKYFSLNGKSPSSFGVTSPYGPRSLFGRNFHAGIDFGTPSGTPISLKGGAALTKNLGNTGAGGYAAEISTPQGPMRILHLLANSIAKIPAAAAMQGPPGMRAMVPGAQSMQVDAANSIKPFSPATAKLDQQTKGLIELNNQTAITEKINLQNEYTKSLAESNKTVLEQSTANLNTAIQKNQVDQRTLDLIVSGTNPALAAQFAQNEQLVAQNKVMLVDQIKKIEGSLQETDLTAEQVNLRMQDVDLLNQQIAAGPQILENLNQQAIKQKEISDATAKLAAEKERVTSLVKGIGASIESGIVSAIDGAITGAKSLQEVLSDVLKDIGKMLISFGVKTLLSSISPTVGGIKMFAEGGRPPVGRPSLVGEKGPELFVPSSSGTIIPADATAAAMARYQRQGSGSGAGSSSSDAMGAGEATPVLSMSFETTRFLGQDYVSTEQLQAAMAATERRATTAGAKAGAAQVSSQMRNSPGYRRQVGLR
jgi:tape measure domain-containing protein